VPDRAPHVTAEPAPPEPALATPGATPTVSPAHAARVRGLGAGLGMTSPLARAALAGAGNQAAARILSRSAKSDELGDILTNQGPAAFIAELRKLTVSDPDVEALLARLAGDDRTLATLLVHLGPESMWPPPVEEYQCPFDLAPQSSPGERILFNGEYLLVHEPIAHYHELVATATNGSFDTQGGTASKTFRTGNDVNRIDTGNFSFFLPTAFAAGDTASVKIDIKTRSTGAVVHTKTWSFTPRSAAPTDVTQSEPGTEVAIGSTYTYTLGPAIPPLAPPFYEHQTVLEEFQQRVSNLDVADMDPAWMLANGITDKAGIDRKLFGAGSNNGTFTADDNDQYFDVHGGGQDTLDEAASHLASPKEVYVDLPQTYTAGPGNVIGTFTVRRIRHADGSYGLRKWKV
jgi:hypothetical protein